MTSLSPISACTEGFRLAKRRPGALMILGGFYLAVVVLLLLALIASQGPAFMGVLRHAAPAADPAKAEHLVGMIAMVWLMVIPALLVVETVISAAIFRVVLRPDERGFGSLRFGADELRLLAVAFLTNLLGCAVGLVATIAAALVIGGVKAAGADEGVSNALGMVTALAVAAGSVWFWVKISMAGPMTFGERKLHIFRSFALTRHHFWPLAGVYALVAVIWVAISGVMSVIVVLFEFLGLGGFLATGAADNTLQGAVNGVLVALMIAVVGIAVCMLVGLFARVVLYAAQASAYQQLTVEPS